MTHGCWECKLVQPEWRTVWTFLKKLKIGLPNDAAILLLGTHPKDTKSLSQKGICTYVFIAALFIIAKTRKCLSAHPHEWIKMFWDIYIYIGFPGGSVVKNPPAMQETQKMRVWSLGREDPLKEGMTTHSGILAWRIPWTESGGLQFIGSQRDMTKATEHAHTYMYI